MEEFKKGQKINLISEEYTHIIKKLGDGGQGIVYLCEYNGKSYALKWYFNNKLKSPDKFYNNLKENIKLGTPTNSFLWPLILTEKQMDSFGYLMDLRPPEYEDFSKFLIAKVKFHSITSVINAALNIVNGFRELHRMGYSYQDLNDGNFFINPINGKVLICDNDNVAPYGENLGIAGKCRYMAPEVVLGNKLPSVHTDRFSLAVALFLLLFSSHPLEGKKTTVPCMTEALEKKFYGSEPVFIFDPKNKENIPVRGIHNNAIKLWPLYPQFIKDAFIKSFTEGINSENARITETAWQKLFIRLRDEIIICSCGCENFFSPDIASIHCMDCKKQIVLPLFLKVKNYKIALYPKNKIYECHTNADNDNYNKPTGEVIRSKSNPAIWGIKNLCNNVWIITMPDGKQNEVKQSEVVKILRGVKIDFGGNQAEII